MKRVLIMVSRCANPDCGLPFLYFRGGKLFSVRRYLTADREEKMVEYFWLCPDCAAQANAKLLIKSIFVSRGMSEEEQRDAELFPGSFAA